ncbi:MAG: hypothetical protein AAB227_04685 [Pseudomonadota bacterium]
MRAVILLGSVMVALLLATYFSVNVYFCSGALKGDFGGCLSMAGADLARSRTAQIASLVCATGALYALRRRRR